MALAATRIDELGNVTDVNCYCKIWSVRSPRVSFGDWFPTFRRKHTAFILKNQVHREEICYIGHGAVNYTDAQTSQFALQYLSRY